MHVGLMLDPLGDPVSVPEQARAAEAAAIARICGRGRSGADPCIAAVRAAARVPALRPKHGLAPAPPAAGPHTAPSDMSL